MDRKLFEEGSDVLLRSIQYSMKMEELHIVVFSLKKHNLKYKKIGNLYLYPTNSSNRINFLFEAYSLGKKIIKSNGLIPGVGVITVQDPMTIVGYFLSKKFKLPIQLQLHTDIFSPYFKNSLATLLNFWYSGLVQVPLTKFFIPRVNGIRVVSQLIKDSIIKNVKNINAPIDILPIFVDINKLVTSYPGRDIKKDFPQFNKVILMASRFTKEKKIDIALESFKNVLSAVPNAGMVICGAGPDEANLKVIVKKLDIENNVVFLPWQKDLVSYYKTADVFLLTSEYEGYGMTLIEAGASGCPIVTTRVGIASSDLFVNDENAYVCEVGDINMITKSIISLLTDQSKKELFKRKIQDSIKNTGLTSEEYTKAYVALLQKLIK